MITRDEALELMAKLDFIEKMLEQPHRITGGNRKEALQDARDVWQYFRDLPIWPEKKGAGALTPGALPVKKESKGTSKEQEQE